MQSGGAFLGGAMGLRIQLLGAFRVWARARALPETAWRRRKAAGLVKLLALAPGHHLHREQVLELLWPDLRLEAAGNNLHRTLHVVRRLLEPDLTTGPSAYLRLSGDIVAVEPAEALQTDVDAFEAAAATARRAGHPAAYQAAVALYTGDLLPQDRYEDWAAGRREALRGLYLAVLLEQAHLHEARREWPPAIAAIEQALAHEPAHEAAHVRLMRLYALAGRRDQALRQYEQLRTALQRDLDAGPAAGSRQLYQDIVGGRFPGEGARVAAQPLAAGGPHHGRAANGPLGVGRMSREASAPVPALTCPAP